MRIGMRASGLMGGRRPAGMRPIRRNVRPRSPSNRPAARAKMIALRALTVLARIG
jgi:hypothetical protein